MSVSCPRGILTKVSEPIPHFLAFQISLYQQIIVILLIALIQYEYQYSNALPLSPTSVSYKL